MSGLYAELRPGSGTPIVLLHGFGGSSAIWSEVVDRLDVANAIIAYDLPGHARSLHFPEAGPPKVAAKAILADLAVRNIEKVHLVGHSMGGAIATLIALAEPGRFATLTLLAPGGYGPEINGPLLRRYAIAADAAEIAACLGEMSGPAATVSPDIVRGMQEKRGLPGQIEMLEKIGAAITKDDRQGVIPRESIGGLAMPVIVAWGSADPVLPYDQSQALPPNCHIVPLPNIGHMLAEEAPGAVAKLILSQVALEV